MKIFPQKSIFERLPVELVDEIARYSAPCVLQTLCLVSKRTGDVATRRLYHTIVLEKRRNAILCFDTLTKRREVASCVRRMAIGVSHPRLFGNFYRLAADALNCTRNLLALDISGLALLLTLIANTTFPRLTEVKLPYSTSLTTFLETNRHLLKAIIIEGPILIVPGSSTLSSCQDFRNVEIPQLQAFVGPCNVIPYVIPGSNVQFLTVCWESQFEPERVEEIVRCIAESKGEVVGMDNLVLGWNPALLGVVAECVPRIERLRIRNVCPLPSAELIKEYLLYLEEGLQKFERLHTLAITLLFNPYEYRLEDLDHEYDLLRRWASLVPTLAVCTLPSMTRWMRITDDHWFPFVDTQVDPHKKLKLHWLLRGFKNGTYPKELFAQISGGMNFDDVEPLVHLGDYSEDEEDDDDDDDDDDFWEDEDDTDDVDSERDWEDGEVDWDEGEDDETLDWGGNDGEGH